MIGHEDTFHFFQETGPFAKPCEERVIGYCRFKTNHIQLDDEGKEKINTEVNNVSQQEELDGAGVQKQRNVGVHISTSEATHGNTALQSMMIEDIKPVLLRKRTARLKTQEGRLKVKK